MSKLFLLPVLLLIFNTLISISSLANAGEAIEKTKINEVEFTLVLPKIDAHPYHKPYVAIWLEDNNRNPVATLALWAKEDTWYKDLRQWWRKLGRNNTPAYDAVTGATRLPGTHHFKIDSKILKDLALEQGSYLLNIEASREEGDRSYFRFPVQLKNNVKESFNMNGELGDLQLTVRTK